jgi:hypothetical protein
VTFRIIKEFIRSSIRAVNGNQIGQKSAVPGSAAPGISPHKSACARDQRVGLREPLGRVVQQMD